MKVRKAVIPAAGLGTRMLPASKTVPKEMLPLVDKPVLQYIIEEAVEAGIEDILIITNRSKSPMDDYFDYYPELERRLSESGKEKELAAIRRPADLANILWGTSPSPCCWETTSCATKSRSSASLLRLPRSMTPQSSGFRRWRTRR